ncbi:MAG: putative baseplate assembly protein, partial [Acidimicrobiales bacterium]
AAGSGERADATQALERDGFRCFSEVPQVGDALVIAVTEPVPSCAVRLRFRCNIHGHGVDPKHPPLAWDAFDGEGWVHCEVDEDSTGGLNRDGDVILHVPPTHVAAIFDEHRAAWIRARVTEAEEGQPAYSSSPIVHAVTADTVGGTVEALNAEIVEGEVLGVSEGVAGQRFRVSRSPVLAGSGAPVLEVSSEEGWEDWTEVRHFAASGPVDRHFVLDAYHGEVSFGPAVRDADGGVRQYGAIPPKDGQLRMRSYTVGGGHGGNVARGAISVVSGSIPFVAKVENRRAAQGGVDGEDLEAAKARGPIVLQTRSRAVTAEDFEQLTREGAPEVARVRCAPAGEGVDAGSVRVLIVPAAPVTDGRIRFEELRPSTATFEAIRRHLDTCRLVGTRVIIEPPNYRGITVVARLVARPRANASRVREDALTALHRHLNPLTGGPDKDGWPFGRPVQSGEIFAVLQAIRGVELVEDVRIFGADPITGVRGQATQRLELGPHDLVFSYEHQVMVEGG